MRYESKANFNDYYEYILCYLCVLQKVKRNVRTIDNVDRQALSDVELLSYHVPQKQNQDLRQHGIFFSLLRSWKYFGLS